MIRDWILKNAAYVFLRGLRIRRALAWLAAEEAPDIRRHVELHRSYQLQIAGMEHREKKIAEPLSKASSSSSVSDASGDVTR